MNYDKLRKAIDSHERELITDLELIAVIHEFENTLLINHVLTWLERDKTRR